MQDTADSVMTLPTTMAYVRPMFLVSVDQGNAIRIEDIKLLDYYGSEESGYEIYAQLRDGCRYLMFKCNTEALGNRKFRQLAKLLDPFAAMLDDD